MPRTSRAVRAGGYYHALNRGNGRQEIFHKDADYAAFARVLAEGLSAYPVDLLAWCLMPNHWHLVLSPRSAETLGRFMGWVGVTHVRRHHEHYHTTGGGHLYQGRFKSFPMQNDKHFLTVCRYVEANPKRAGLVERAEDWPWSSLAEPRPARSLDGKPQWPTLGRWPVRKPPGWAGLVNRVMSKKDQDRLRISVNRGRPFGDADWVAQTSAELGLGYTMRERGRPKKPTEAVIKEIK